MLTKRFNWRTVAMIFACLAVTTMFASCDEENGDDGSGDGKIDSALLGGWYRTTTMTEIRRYNIHFNNDGTFEYFQHIRNITTAILGIYSVSDGKIYFSESYWLYADGSKGIKEDWIAEYSIGTDNKGEYLVTGDINPLSLYAKIEPAFTYRRYAGDE